MEEIPGPPQVDYRTTPSYGHTGSIDQHLDGYDHPTEPGAYSASPPTDQTWKGYDERDDATRFNGVNTPLEQADLHAEPDPAIGSLGYSPDLEQALAWERKVTGAPPS